MRKLARKPVTWVVVGVAVAAIAFGLYWFQPWRLFTSTTVDDALPTAAPSAPAASGDAMDGAGQNLPKLLAEGEFVTHEHDTTGTAQLFRKPDGSIALALAGLDTSDGPDLHVYLSDQPVGDDWHAFDDGFYADLGSLKGNKGDQLYEVPASVDLAKVTSVSIWCARFSVSFGAAPLAAG